MAQLSNFDDLHDKLIIQLTFFFLVFTGRYEAPEVFGDEEYDTKVDVFSFALILQEVQVSSFVLELDLLLKG